MKTSKSISTTGLALGIALLGAVGGCAQESSESEQPGVELPDEDDFVSGGKADGFGPAADQMFRWRRANERRWDDMAHCDVDPSCEVVRPIATEKNGQRVLVVITGVDAFKVYDTDKREMTTFPGGYFLRELIDSLEALLEDGYEVDFATTDGEAPRIDENGQNPLFYSIPKRFAFRASERADAARHYMNQAVAERGVITLEQALERVDTYSGALFPGGHGPMEDWPNNATFGKILEHMHDAGKPTAMVCHAPIGLLATRDKVEKTSGEWLGWDFTPNPTWRYAGYRVATASTAEEKSVRWFGYLPNELHVTYYVDQELAEAGVKLVQNPIPSFAMATRDRELITGQNPWSSHYVAEGLIEALAEGANP